MRFSGRLANGTPYACELQHPCTKCGRYISSDVASHGPGRDGAFFCGGTRGDVNVGKSRVAVHVQKRPNHYRAATPGERSEVLRYLFATVSGKRVPS